MSLVTITVTNWAKYNPRQDRTNFTWFRFENAFFTDQKLFGLSDSQVVLLLLILCEASKKSSDRVEMNLDFIASLRATTRSKIADDIQRLADRGVIVTAECRQIAGNVPSKSRTTNERTNETNETNETYAPPGSPPPTILDALSPDAVPTDKDLNREIWAAYSAAYAGRYGVDPVRNASVNAKVSQLRSRLGKDAVEVVRFFVSSNNSFYARGLHAIGLCLKDAESLHTQWLKGRALTEADVRNLEKANKAQDIHRRIEEGI